MMKSPFIISLTCFAAVLIAAPSAVAQSSKLTEIQNLTKRSSEFLRSGKFNEAITTSENALQLAKSFNKVNEVIASANLAIALSRRFESMIGLYRSSENKTDVAYKPVLADYSRSSMLFGDAIKAAQSLPIKKSLTGLWKRELGWMFITHSIMRPGPLENEQAVISATIDLYESALRDYEASIPLNSIFRLQALGELARLRYINQDFEAAIPLYRDFIKFSPRILPIEQIQSAYIDLIQIYRMISDSHETDALLRNLSDLTGKTTPVPLTEIYLTKRTSDYRPPEFRTFSFDDFMSGRYGTNPDRRQRTVVGPLPRPKEFQLSYSVVLLDVLVDENGQVMSVRAKDGPVDVANRAEQQVSEWKFRPFVFEGRKRQMRGLVVYYVNP